MNTVILHSLLFLNIVFIGLVTGGAMVVAVAYNRLLADLARPETLIVHRGLGQYIDPYQPTLAMIGLAAGIGELFFIHSSWQMLCLLLGIGGIAVLIVLSRTISVPLSRKIVSWDPATGEDHLEQMKTRWIGYHWLRSSFGLLGFLFFVVAALLLI